MPKKSYIVKLFDGGLNTDTNTTDIEDNEFQDLDGVLLNKKGNIRLAGAVDGLTYDDMPLIAGSHLLFPWPAGHGLIQVGSDVDWNGLTSWEWTEFGDEFVSQGRNKFTIIQEDGFFHVYDFQNGMWMNEDNVAYDSGGTPTPLRFGKWSAELSSYIGGTMVGFFKLNHYHHNNAIRLSGLGLKMLAGFDNEQQEEDVRFESKWLGFIDNTYMHVAGNLAGPTFGSKSWKRKGYYLEPQYIAPPEDVFLSDEHGTSGTPAAGKCSNAWDDNHWNEVTTANLISVSLSPTTNAAFEISEEMKTTWVMGISYCYDGIYSTSTKSPGCNGDFVQESRIFGCRRSLGSYTYMKWDLSDETLAQIIQLHFKAGRKRNEAVNGQYLGMNSRVTGMNLYIKEFEGESFGLQESPIAIKPWLLLASIDLLIGNYKSFGITEDINTTGLHHFQVNRLTQFSDDEGTNNVSSDGAAGEGSEWFVPTEASTTADPDASLTDTVKNGILCNSLPIESYYAKNGYHEDSLIDCRYQASTVIENSAYIGNIYDITNGKAYDDRIIRTPQNKLDTFSLEHFADVVPGDGDSIIHLDNYANKLLVFKQNSFSIVSVDGENMKLEEQIYGFGIKYAGQSAHTELGVIWCNPSGVHIYNGSTVETLTDNKIQTTWDLFYRDEGVTFALNFTSIGFDQKSKHIVLLQNNRASTSVPTDHGNVLIYDMKIKAWSYVKEYFSDFQVYANHNIKSNFIQTSDNKLVVYDNRHPDFEGYVLNSSRFREYTDISGNRASLSIKTKFFDFGHPQARKKVYKVYVTYKSSSDTNVRVRFEVDGGESFGKDFSAGTKYTSSSLDDTSSVWKIAELIPDTPSEANNIYSFALHFHSTGTVPATFEINDITIVYRDKKIK